MLFTQTLKQVLASALMAVMATAIHAQTLQGEALVRALDLGGYVLVMRHAASPLDAPGALETCICLFALFNNKQERSPST